MMQQLSRQCCRLVPVVRHSTTPLVVREVLPAALAQTQNTSVAAQSHWLRGPSIWHNSQASRASFSTAASDGRDPTADNEPKLEPTLQQQKAALKPATGRNQFQRMWKKATQTRAKVDAQHHCPLTFASLAQLTRNLYLLTPVCMQNAHKTRRQQQAKANEQRQKSHQARWREYAALWRGQTSEQSL